MSTTGCGSLQSGPPDVDCPTPPGPSPLGIPGARKRRRAELLSEKAFGWKVLNHQGINRTERKDLAGSDLQPPCTGRRPLAAGPSLPGVTRRMRCRPGSARACRPVYEMRPTCAGSCPRPPKDSPRKRWTLTKPNANQQSRGDAARLSHGSDHHRSNRAILSCETICCATFYGTAAAGQVHLIPTPAIGGFFATVKHRPVGWQVPQPW